jgi:hypothetical protein
MMPHAYRMLTYDFDKLCVESPQAKNPVDITIGREFVYCDGILLYKNPDGDRPLLPPDKPQVLLTFEYQLTDLVGAEAALTESLLITRATLKAVVFQDPAVQHRFGHLLAPEITQERRANIRQESLQAKKGKLLCGVVRAMDARSRHTHPMDYVYLAEPASISGVAKAVVSAYEDGDMPRTQLQRMLMKTLEHAVTTAIYEGAAQHVTYALASTADLYRAPNEGEFFFDSPEPLKMQVLICVNECGEVSLPVSAPVVKSNLEDSPPVSLR